MLNQSILHHPSGAFTALLHNSSGRWKVFSGLRSERDLSQFAGGLDTTPVESAYKVITVFLNNSCNLRCSYCRFDKVTHTGLEFGTRDLDGVVNSVRSLAKNGDEVELHFQGGEPLLRHSDIDLVCDALSAPGLPFHCRFHLTTNGTIATRKALDVIERHAINVTVSLDGLRKDHDAHRVFANGTGSFDRVLATLAAFRERHIPFGLFCVVTDPDSLAEIQSYLVESVGAYTFLLAPLEVDGLESADEVGDYLKKFFRNQLALLESNIDRFVAGGDLIREHLGILLLRGKAMPGYFSKACGNTPHSKCGDQMNSIERDGTIRPCQNTRMIAAESDGYVKSCLTRHGICETCEIRAHCSTPICFSRMAPTLVKDFAAGERGARNYVKTVCDRLKERELALFELFFRRKRDVIDYLAACS